TGTLNILPGTIVLGDSVEIRVEGKLIANGDSDSPISFSSFSPSVIGVDLIIAPNSSQESVIKHCRFKNSDKAINVGRSLFQKISNCEFRECNYGVWSVSQPGYVVRLDSCLFVNRDFDSEGVHLYSSRNYSSINECMFIGSMKPIYAINGILKVSNCFFENTAGYLAEEDVAAIAYIMMEGPIERNTIYSYPIGIALYDSDASLISNKIEDSLNEGIWLMSASYPDMTNAGAGAYNWLKGNGIEDLIPTQVLISGNVYPHLDGGLNNIWQATNGFAFISSTPSTVTVTMASNYWGTTNPLVDDLFNPSSSNLSIDNYLAVEQIPAEGYQTRSVMTDLYNSALLAISQDDIASALDMLQTIASTDGEEGIRIGSMSLMNAYWLEDGRDPQLLLDNHLAIADTTMSLKVQLEALRCHAYANAMMGNYTEALDYYEQRLEDPTISSVDSLCTLIDIENITLMSIGEYDLMSIQQGDGPRLLTKDMSTSISENWAEVPEAEYHQYLTKTEQLIKELRGSSHSDSPDQVVELPKEYYLYQNYPNPFNPSTHITFDLVHGGEVTLRVFNVLGQQVLQPLQSRMDAGKHTISVDMQNQSSGIYFYTLSTEKFHETKKMVLLR
ncbi:MAG TPA: T9SS type A sorting domain-containing protein, partial [Bacteroidetes bacterium]|nr:T9SS type A sorting domain-containing protein [Bacteroidota bacterium]HEX05386.1 T9SS type A sorting domain-containing protein [Bacteroidota bacterium]